MSYLRGAPFAVALLLAFTFSLPAAAEEPPFQVEAAQAILLDASTGTVLYEKNADQQMSPSSMTKLMTAYLVFEALKHGELNLDDELPVSERAWRMGGSQMFIEVGERVSVENLVSGMIVISGNDACVALAEGIAGSEEYFAEKMTEKAKELGMTNSNFLNSHGLHEEGHHSSARDLAILAEHIIKDFPEYYDYYSRDSFAYGEDMKTGKPIMQYNRNPILGVVAGADGLKTGFTDAGGYGLTASAKRGDTRLIMVINGEPTHRLRASEAERILNWGFRSFGTYTLLTEGQVIEETPVWLGEKAKVPLVVGKEVRLTLSREARRKVKGEVIYNTPVPAAIEKGAPLGRIVLAIPDMEPIEVPLVAGEDVPKVGGLSKIGSAFDYLVFGSSGEE